MAKKDSRRIFDLKQTRGSFQVAGEVVGTQSDKFFTEKDTKNGGKFRNVNFGAKIDGAGDTVYLSLNGNTRDYAYFYRKQNKDKGIEAKTESVPWKDRNSFEKEGFKLMGVNVGLVRVVGEDGKEHNKSTTMVEYDACEEVRDKLTDGASVFVKGSTEFKSYKGRSQIKFVPSQVSLCKPIDFDKEDFEPTAAFTQELVFMGIKQSDDKTRFIVEAMIVNYDSIENIEMFVTNPTLAKTLRTLKPYTGLKVFGEIVVKTESDEVEQDDGWGETNKMDRVKSPTTREFVITGAYKESVDKETYTEDAVDEAIAKINANKQAQQDYSGDTHEAGDDWGATPIAGDTSEDEPW